MSVQLTPVEREQEEVHGSTEAGDSEGMGSHRKRGGGGREARDSFHDIEFGVDDMVAFFKELVRSQDDPIADIADYGYYYVMKIAKTEAVPVVIQGQGGDELF